MFNLVDLLLLSILFLAVTYWWNDRGVKQIALLACQRHCQNMDVQMLDQSIQLERLKLRRNQQGTLCFQRYFVFEFSTAGDRRYKGRAKLIGKRVVTIELEPHRFETPYPEV